MIKVLDETLVEKAHGSEFGEPHSLRALPPNQGLPPYAGTGATNPGYRNTKYEVTVTVVVMASNGSKHGVVPEYLSTSYGVPQGVLDSSVSINRPLRAAPVPEPFTDICNWPGASIQKELVVLKSCLIRLQS